MKKGWILKEEVLKRKRQWDFIEDRAKIWKEHTEKIMNEENKWDHMVETDVAEGPVEKVTCKKLRLRKQCKR